MIRVRSGRERGHLDNGWLDTYHTFSFGAYHDPAHMRFRALRVINEDVVAPGTGLGRHGHRDMEILTHVRSGALEHRDSLGHGEILPAGHWQHMTAGTGIEHSEFNPSPTEPVHLYQIWLFPERRGLAPGYAQTVEPTRPTPGRWIRVAAPTGQPALLAIHQDAAVLHGAVDSGHALSHNLAPGRAAYVQVLAGHVRLAGQTLAAGDGAAVTDEPAVVLEADEAAEVIVLDLA